MMEYCIFLTTATQDVWLMESKTDNLKTMADYIKANKWKLDKVVGPWGEWDVWHFEKGKTLNELRLTDEENEELWKLVKG